MRRWGRFPRRDAREMRDLMVERQLKGRGLRDPEVLAAMASVPRDRFVPRDQEAHAYEDNALPIGRGQTISQPYIVARMTEALALPAWRADHPARPMRVLDIGTGSGYQAAVLAAMGAQVISIERDQALADSARERLHRLGYAVEVIVGDGSNGAPDRAPFAGIIAAAASPSVPEPLVAQLDEGARLVVPVGSRFEQQLTVVRRAGNETVSEPMEAAVFVPLVGEHGFPER